MVRFTSIGYLDFRLGSTKFIIISIVSENNKPLGSTSSQLVYHMLIIFNIYVTAVGTIYDSVSESRCSLFPRDLPIDQLLPLIALEFSTWSVSVIDTNSFSYRAVNILAHIWSSLVFNLYLIFNIFLYYSFSRYTVYYNYAY